MEINFKTNLLLCSKLVETETVNFSNEILNFKNKLAN